MPSKRELTKRAIVAALVAGAVVAAALVVAIGVSVVVAYVLGLGLSTFLIYGYDKLRATRGGRRGAGVSAARAGADRRRARRVGGDADLAPQDSARDLLDCTSDRDNRDRRRALAGVTPPRRAQCAGVA
jgi:hypothetical protein